jgi:hypothetical protein
LRHKKKLLKSICQKIFIKRTAHKKAAIRYKHIDLCTDGVAVLFSSLCVSSSIVQISETNQTVAITTAIFSTMATLILATKNTLGIKERWVSSKATSDALSDMTREIRIFLSRSDASENDYDTFLHSIHARLSLVDDSAQLLESYNGEERLETRFSTIEPDTTPSPVEAVRISVSDILE